MLNVKLSTYMDACFIILFYVFEYFHVKNSKKKNGDIGKALDIVSIQ